MNQTRYRVLLSLALLFVLGAVNLSIAGKERIKTQGEVILLELAPVDPRSLMQGDYMALRFALADQLNSNGLDIEGPGSAPVELDANRVARAGPRRRARPAAHSLPRA